MFYLISFVGLLWATFLSVQGVMLWVSTFLVIVIIGIHFFTLYNQILLRRKRKEASGTTGTGVRTGSKGRRQQKNPMTMTWFFQVWS